MRHYLLLSLVFASVAACASDDGPSSCSCDVTYNGVSQSLACGTTACVNGQSYTCGESADITMGGTCSGGSGTSGGMFDCNGTMCDAATEYCILSAIGDTTASSVCAPLPTSCTSCDCIGDVEPTWKELENNTDNCTGATQYCSSSNGEVTVTCQK